MIASKENTSFDFVKDIAERLNTLSISMKVVSSYRQPGDLVMLPVVSEFTARSLVKNAPAHLYWLHACQMENSRQRSCGKAPAIPVFSTYGVKSSFQAFA